MRQNLFQNFQKVQHNTQNQFSFNHNNIIRFLILESANFENFFTIHDSKMPLSKIDFYCISTNKFLQRFTQHFLKRHLER